MGRESELGGRENYVGRQEQQCAEKNYRVIFFKWGKVLRHQILVMTFQDESKLVYSCKILDIYFSRKKKYFWQILLIFLSNPKFQENQCFFMKLLIWMKLKLQNYSKKLF